MKTISALCCFVCCLFIIPSCWAVRTYPKALNLALYTSYQMEFKSEDTLTEIRYKEFELGSKKRLDMETIKPQPTKISFRTNGRNCYSILTNLALNEQICTQEGSIDGMFQMSHYLRIFSENAATLTWAGEELVDGVNCDVWRWSNDSQSVDVYIKVGDHVEPHQSLHKLITIDNDAGGTRTTLYSNFLIVFNPSIENDTFEVPKELDCD